MGLFPEIPPTAKQTNCWRALFVWILIVFPLIIIGNIINGISFGLIFLSILEYACCIIILYHVAYVEVNISDEMIDISMGPWQWPVCRWFFSSQVYKEEIFVVENKQRECCYDVIPRLYCYPIAWCCCHKSYSAYWWPFCCNDSCNLCNLCDGDTETSNYMLIYLTEDPMEFTQMCCKRCAPCPVSIAWCWCCVYNRIAVSVNPNQNYINTLENLGYPLRINANIMAAQGMATQDGNQTAFHQMQDTQQATKIQTQQPQTMGNGVYANSGEDYRPPV